MCPASTLAPQLGLRYLPTMGRSRMPAIRFGCFALFCLAGACGGGSSQSTFPDGPGMNARRFATLQQKAEGQLRCAPEQITYRFVESWAQNSHLYVAEGCGSLLETVLACSGYCNWIDLPTTRAAFDLQCSEGQLTRTYLGGGALGYSGCGRTVTYLTVGQTWVANTGSSSN